MVSLEHLSLSFGERILFKDVHCTIGTHDRIGLVGPNGSGKSTLLKILLGIIPPTTGKVQKAKYVSIGYLPQEGITTGTATVYEEAQTAFSHILELQERIETSHEQLQTLSPDDSRYSEALEIAGELQHRIEGLDAYRMQATIEEVLHGLGFKNSDFTRQASEFSGGWQMRIALAKLLLQQPTLLLLDEPTNHLDIDSQEWLEKFLQQYDGAVLLVSHDRAFLDAITEKTFALNQQTLQVYNGNYSAYREQEAQEQILLEHRYRQQQKQIQETQEFIDRFRYKATKARQVQSRIKQLEKMERVELREKEDSVSFHFPPSVRSGKIVFELQNASKRYASLSLFEHLSLTVHRGDKIALVGTNGSGKSTLLRILAGIEQLTEGEYRKGYNVHLAYFAQHQADELDPTKDILSTLEAVATAATRTELRTLLGCFLFRGDDVFKPVSVLSGGEKSRLALAKILVQQANVLLMDEPTNHLDMESKEILQEALNEYDGTLLIASHDRAFLDPFVNKVWHVNNGGVREYLGTVSDFLMKKNEAEEETNIKKTPVPSSPTSWHQQQQEKKALAREVRRLTKNIGEVEARIHILENRKAEIERALSAPASYENNDINALSAEYSSLQSELENAYAQWTLLSERLESISSQ